MPPKSAALFAENERRAAFLVAASHALSVSNPQIARHLSWRAAATVNSVNKANSQTSNQSNNPSEVLTIGQSVVDHTCSKCSAILIPGVTCTVRRKKINSNTAAIGQSTDSQQTVDKPDASHPLSKVRHLTRVTAISQHCHQCGHTQLVKQSIVRRGYGGEKLSVKFDREKRVTTVKKRKLDQAKSIQASDNATDNPTSNQRELQRQEEHALKKLKTQRKFAQSTRPVQSIKQSDQSPLPFAGSMFFRLQREAAQANKQMIMNQSSPTGESSPTAPFTFSASRPSAAGSPTGLSMLEAAALKKKQEAKAAKSKLSFDQSSSPTSSSPTNNSSASRPAKPITVNPTMLAGGGLYNLMQGFAKR